MPPLSFFIAFLPLVFLLFIRQIENWIWKWHARKILFHFCACYVYNHTHSAQWTSSPLKLMRNVSKVNFFHRVTYCGKKLFTLIYHCGMQVRAIIIFSAQRFQFLELKLNNIHFYALFIEVFHSVICLCTFWNMLWSLIDFEGWDNFLREFYALIFRKEILRMKFQ